MPGGKIEVLVEPDLRGFPGKLESGLKSSTGIATKVGSGIATALGVGLLGAGAAFTKIVSLTTEFQDSLNSLQAVSGATADQMAQVSAKATELGNDITLPGTSAKTAAEAMLELAKGGLTVQQAMDAAKGTLTLAAAAQIDGAKAASIQSDALNQFGLKATDASHVADLLANAANASAVEITDVAESMKFVGPVAKGMNISIEDTTTAIALLGNAGIRGSEAGTSLRGMLASLVAPSKQSGQALATLGVNAFDSQGKFVGFESVVDQLRVSQGKLTDAQFQGAVATAFGRETMSGVLALVNSAPGAWDKMSAAVTKQGGAQDVASAKMKGLGGAIEGLKGQLETTAITIGQAISPALESLVKSATGVVGALTDVATGSGDVAAKLPGVNRALEVGKGLWEDLRLVLVNVKGAADPVIDAIGRLSKSATDKGGALSALATGLDHLGNAAVGASQLLGPVGETLGVVARVAGVLPGPVAAAALAFLGFKAAQGILSNLRGETDKTGTSAGKLGKAIDGVTAPARNAVGGFKAFTQEMQAQRAIHAALGGQFQNTSGTLRQLATDAAGTGRGFAEAAPKLSLLGAAQAAFETSTVRSVSALRTFRDDVRTMSAAAEGAGRPISGLTASFQALEQRSSTLSSMAQSFRTVSSAVRDLAPAVEEGVGGRFTTAIEKGRGALNRFTSVAAGAGASLGTGLLKGAGSLIGFLGGPWGIALAGAGIALDLLGARQEHAAQAAAQHQQKVDGLRGSLDSLSGSATDATRSMVAQDLTQTKLSDGTTTLGSALTRAGISATDFVDATTGNQGKLDQLNATLFTQAKATLQNSDAWRNNSGEFAKAGVSLDLATAAALGNVQAQDEMQRKLDANGQGWDGLSDKVRNAIGPLGEIGAQLGAQAGAFAEATAGQKAAGAAAQNYNDVLKTLAENKAFEVLRNGGQITEPMRAGFDALGASAERMATDAGKAASAISGIEGGAVKARESMQASRDSFIQSATAAGISAEQAGRLADQIGLIPAAAETIFRTNATGVTAELVTLKAQFDAVPGEKSVTVQALTDEAKAKLVDMGFTVTTLPNGTIQVTANTDPAKANLAAAVAATNAATGVMTIDGNKDPATGKVQQAVTFADGSKGTITVDGNPVPANGKTTGAVKFADGSKGTITIDGNQTPANGKINATVTFANGKTGTIKVDANAAAANSAIQGVVTKWNGYTIRLNAVVSSRIGGLAAGGIVQKMHDGGVVAMAHGGHAMPRLTPMRGGHANIVAPNTWRVVGDRLKDDEAYIPINGSTRSRAIFMETAKRMGYAVARMYADGGVAARTSTASVTAARVSQVALSDAAVVAQLAALRKEIAQVRSVTYAPTINNPRGETPAASSAAALRTASAMSRL